MTVEACSSSRVLRRSMRKLLRPGRASLDLSKRAICNNTPAIDLRTSGSQINLELSDGVVFYTSTAFYTTGWHHFAGGREGATMRVYLDGFLADEDSTETVLDMEDTIDLGIGTSPCVGIDGTEALQGSLDDLRIHSRALGPSEIDALIPLFVHGFEFGDTLGWSVTVP